MLSRARRQDLMNPSQAEAGPGSYEPTVPSFKPKSGMAPFCSTTERKTVEMPQFATPGPGAYNSIPEKRIDIKPSPQFMSKEIRIAADKDRLKAFATPGPGSYTGELVKEPLVKPPTTAPRQNLSWVKIATVPSIPAAGQAHGYEEGKSGELVQQAAPFSGHSGRTGDVPGPGEYNPKVMPKSNRGTNFAKSSGTRLSVVPKELMANPGPGSYKPEESGTSIQFKGGIMAKRPTSMFASTTSRTKLGASEGGPGPGQYKPKSSFASLREHLAANPESFHAFGSSGQQPHIKTGEVSVPGPGTYAPQFPSQKNKTSSAFASTSSRFLQGKVDESPGPGVYETNDYTFTRELGKKLKGKYGAFGSSSSRFQREKPVTNTSPASYTVTENNTADLRRKDKRTSAFRSSAVRKDTTPVASGAATFYDVKNEWSKPSTTSKSFISNVARFKTEKRSEVPGPGTYERGTQFTNEAKGPSTKSSFGGANRFQRGHTESVPGPGTYNTTPSMVRNTFNITIGDAWE